jgi:hypothetical protein
MLLTSSEAAWYSFHMLHVSPGRMVFGKMTKFVKPQRRSVPSKFELEAILLERRWTNATA